MKRLLLAVVACLVIALAGTGYLSTRVDGDAVLRATAERVAILTGKRTEVRGPIDVTFFPMPQFVLRDVVLAPRFNERIEEVASIDLVRGSVALLPLLTGQVVLKDLVLERPRVTFAIDRRGRPNWRIPRRGDSAADSRNDNAEGRSDETGAGTDPSERLPDDLPEADLIEDLPIGSFRIVDGSIAYENERTGTAQTITAIDATVSWSRFAAPLDAAGGLIWNGEAVRFDLSAGKPLDFMNHGTTPARIRFQSDVVNGTFSGNAHYTADPQLEGALTMAAPSARGLLRWIGADPGRGPGLNGIELTGTLNLIGKTLSLSGLALTLDGNEAEGVVEVDLSGPRTGLQGTLAFDTLDLGRYRTRNDTNAETVPPAKAAMSAVLDMSVLDGIAVDLRVSAGSVSYGDLVLGRSAGTVAVRKGVFDLGVGEATLYGGTAQGSVMASASPDGAEVKVAFGLEKVDIGALMTALIGETRISGPTTARINLSGTGRTVADIVADLSGQAKLAIAPGDIIGLDAEALLGALESGAVEGWPTTKVSTAFETLTATFSVVGGNAATEDFAITGSRVDVAAEGEIRLVSASVAGHGTADFGDAADQAENGTKGPFSIPFVIEGPIARPTIYPDPIWLLNRPAAKPEEIEKIRTDLQQSSPEDVIEDLVRRGRDTPPQPAPKTEQPGAPQQ